jgi:antitoxin component of MazEF toxin-antitoxin module
MGFDRETHTGLSIHKLGNSEGVVIPKEWREDLDLDDDDLADAEYDRERGTVTFHF